MSGKLKIEIETIDNGAILRFPGDDESAECYCYPYDDEGQGDYVLHLLRDIASYISGSDSRHSEKRISVSWVHGDKYECKAKDCKICQGNE